MVLTKPVVTTLLLCEKIITDSRTRANTLVNIFNQIVVREFPAVIRGYVFVVLGDGKGEAAFRCQVRKLDSEDYETICPLSEGSFRFESSVIPTQLTIDFAFEVLQPGVFAVELFIGGEYLSSVKLRVVDAQPYNKE